MSCTSRLDALVDYFESEFPCRDHWLADTARGWQAHTRFLSRYKPDGITSRLRGADDVRGFLRWLNVDLRALGYINLRKRQIDAAAASPRAFRDAVSVAVDGSRSLSSRIDHDSWATITGFGRSDASDRLPAKKIIATYFPKETMPIFNTRHLEDFVFDERLGLNKEAVAQAFWGKPYYSLSVGEKWELLSTTLIDSKGHSQRLAQRDNAYFMGVLYAGPARPPEMSPNPCPRHPTVVVNTSQPMVQRIQPPVAEGISGEPIDDVYEMETGIKKGQLFYKSKAARKEIELRAMELAKEYYAARGYSVDDTSRNHPYDLRCTRLGDELRVEVKGKTDDGSRVLLTRNEVTNAREFPRVALFIVSHIRVSESGGRPVASGGQHREWNPWEIDAGKLDCFQYEYAPAPANN